MEPDPSAVVARRRILGKRPPEAPIALRTLGTSTKASPSEEEDGPPSAESYKVNDIRSVAKLEYLLDKDMMKPLAQISYEKQWFAL